MTKELLLYLCVINVFAASLFCYDKLAAMMNFRRIPEAVLHLLEAIGGVFAIFILLFLIRHKNKKTKYNRWTKWFALIWLLLILYFK